MAIHSHTLKVVDRHGKLTFCQTFGSPEGALVIEDAIEKIAKELGLDPLWLERETLVKLQIELLHCIVGFIHLFVKQKYLEIQVASI